MVEKVEFFRGSLDRKDVSKYINVADPPVTEIVQLWTEMSFEGAIKSIEHLLSLNLWHNSRVKIGKEPNHGPLGEFKSPGARFSKAPESFRTRKAIFRSSVSKNGEVYTPETSCMKGTSLHLLNI